jgi:hypothetical protein
MPKETIGRQQLSSNASPESRVILKWGRESNDAQLGIEFDEYFVFNKDSHKKDQPTFNSLWFNFETREDYNRLIRALRKARDDVDGKDA